MCQMQGRAVGKQDVNNRRGVWVGVGVSLWGEEMDKWVNKSTAGELQPVDVFNELNWFTGLAYILCAASASYTFTYSWSPNCRQLHRRLSGSPREIQGYSYLLQILRYL